MVFEVAAEHAVHWMAPQDANEQLVMESGPDSGHNHGDGMHALFVDGSAPFLDSSTTADRFRRMISISGNDNESLGDLTD